ncbi:MAG: diaminopimelate epimerase [Candidatus Omnitrophica bacterium]|nr:diaminopimelate epimerase [Candidatus Omnitrophota bacterium]
MRKIEFTKLVASGNDFIIINYGIWMNKYGLRKLAKKICDRRYGIGADGLLVLEKSKIADIKMRIFNPDGSEAEMCGNGARCTALYVKSQIPNSKSQINLETKAQIVEAEVNKDNVRIKLTAPRDLKLDIPIKINNRLLKVNFIHTGVPHTVIFVEGLDKIDVVNLGRTIRYHKRFQPQGTNVDFVEVLSDDSIKIRTYERGVEDETLSCGTGAVSSALVTESHLKYPGFKRINVYTKSDEVLKVYFRRINNEFEDVWLEGKVRIVYKGVGYV